MHLECIYMYMVIHLCGHRYESTCVHTCTEAIDLVTLYTEAGSLEPGASPGNPISLSDHCYRRTAVSEFVSVCVLGIQAQVLTVHHQHFVH